MKLVRSSLLVKLLIAVVVIYAAVTLVRLRAQLSEQKQQAAELEQQITTVQQENNRIRDSIDRLDTDEGIEEAAREKLDMVDQDEIKFYDVSH